VHSDLSGRELLIEISLSPSLSPSLALSLSRWQSVLVTDYDAGALAIANENIILNNLSHLVSTARWARSGLITVFLNSKVDF